MKTYTGSVYIGVVGGDTDIGMCRDSIHALQLRAGDKYPYWIRATKGYEARQLHLDKWYEEGKHEFILLLDHDMVFPTDTLERLRSHARPFLTGYYLRRHYAPIAPVWLHAPRNGWPYIPYTQDPDPTVLHELGASGWGCILMHRDVVTAVKGLLKGEKEVLEDDMDVYPYDLQKMMQAIHALRELSNTHPKNSILYPALEAYVQTLEQEFRPLRGVKTPIIGSDIRFPHFARLAGFKLYGDASVRCGHVTNYPLHPDDYTGTPEDIRLDLTQQVEKFVGQQRRIFKKELEGLK